MPRVSPAPSVSELDAVLGQLARQREPARAFELLQQQPQWITPQWIDAVYERALALRLSEGVLVRVKLVARIGGAFIRACQLASFSDFARLLEDHALVGTSSFRRLVQSLTQNGQIQATVFGVHRSEWDERLHQAKRYASFAKAYLKDPTIEPRIRKTGYSLADLSAGAGAFPGAVTQESLRCLRSMILHDIVEGTGEFAAEWICDAELLETLGFNAVQWKLPGIRKVFRHLNSGEATLWFAQLDFEYASALAAGVDSRKVSWDEAVDRIQRRALSAYQEVPRTGGETIPSREFQLITRTTAFCVLLATLFDTVGNAIAAVDKFREIVMGRWTASQPPHERGTAILRYCWFVFYQSPRLPDVREKLTEAYQLASEACAALPAGAHPGLLRDLKLVCARQQGELARFDPDCDARAARLFAEALDTSWAALDAETQGQGRSDWAGALWRNRSMARTPARRLETEVDALYQQAIAFLRARFERAEATVLRRSKRGG